MSLRLAGVAAALFAAFALTPASAQSRPTSDGRIVVAQDVESTPKRSRRAAKSKKEPTAGQLAARERQKKCAAEWKVAKAANKTGGQKWPQFWSKCNSRLKGDSA
jgi:hypothetical protein